MKRAVGVADCRHAVGEAIERNAMKRAVGVADCMQACCRKDQGEACHEEGGL
jgi:hypothetical protein